MGTVRERPKQERFTFIAENAARFGIRYLCQRLAVSVAGFYKWRSAAVAPRALENLRISKEIQRIFRLHHGNYGSPRVHAVLRDQGERVNLKRVERLMHELGLVGKAGRIYRRKASPANPCILVGNQMRQVKFPTAPNLLWAGDVTYLQVNGQWKFLAVVIDVYSRRVIGWALGHKRTATLTLKALKNAISQRDVSPGLIFHSDRGAEYGAYIFQDELRRAGITPSINRPKHMTDNAHVESFFKTLKTESFKGLHFNDSGEVYRMLKRYIDAYYNTKRIHSALGFKTPAQYETMTICS